MTTHETGESIDAIGRRQDNDMDNEDDGDDEPEQGHDEEKKVGMEGKKEIVLQDQTNLLPKRQVMFVLLGLACALFCSLLDQTM